MLPTPTPALPPPLLATLGNGVRVLAIPLPFLATAAVSVFVRTGSAHESRVLNGISHVVEHMAFKGSATRDARRINLDAERLGAEVNAHTDKDHTAFHMRGLARDAEAFVRMLGDIVLHPTFPADELAREREVLLHEYTEDEDDPLAAAFRLFDRACFGLHPVAQPVIGTRANLQRITTEALSAYVQRQYSGANIVVAAAGAIDVEALQRAAEAAFGALPAGTPNAVAPPVWHGGLRARRLGGSSQTHLVLGFPLPSLVDDDPAGEVAATLFGDGMSSPLLDRVREQRALAYYTACSADLLDLCGQFVVEASTAPAQLDEFVAEVATLLRRQAEAVDAVDLERAHNQLAVRRLRALEKPARRIEDAALDLFVHGRVRPYDEQLQRSAAVDAAAVREAFARLLAAPLALAVTGAVPPGTRDRLRRLLEAQGLRLAAEGGAGDTG